MNYTMTPSPLKVSQRGGSIRIADIRRFESEFVLPESVARTFARFDGKGVGDLKLRITRNALAAEGGYELKVDRDGVELAASGLEGVRHAARRPGPTAPGSPGHILRRLEREHARHGSGDVEFPADLRQARFANARHALVSDRHAPLAF